MIPLVDLEKQYRRLRPQILAKIEEVLESRAFIQGKYAKQFEAAFAAAHNAPFAVGCSNGTSAIYLALAALDIRPGDEVITVPNTFIATAEAIVEAGATPIFVDINPQTHQMDVALVERAITKRTRAIMPVHLYGNVVDMDPLLDLATKYDLRVVEDSAQAHLATYKGRYAGTMGDAGTFSFYPGKNLGAYGDAGMVLCRRAEHDAKVRKLVDHGRMSKYEHDLVGHNHRMDGLQAAILHTKLQYLSEWTASRRRTAALYDRLLADSGVKSVVPTKHADPVYHLYVVQVSNREEVVAALDKRGIATGIHYPVPLHLQPALRYLGYAKGDFPVTERVASQILSLPICAELSVEDVQLIAKEFCSVARP